jgi:hypothetical protein
MEAISTPDFFRWASGVGVGFDPRYPDARSLRLSRDHARFWVLPGDPAAWPHFVGSYLDGFDEWNSGFLWPCSGAWPVLGQAGTDAEAVRHIVLRGADVPSGWDGALRFGKSDYDSIIAIVFAYLVFGGCIDDDLFVVPDHGHQLIQTDHHDVIHVECGSEDRVLKFVRSHGDVRLRVGDGAAR